MKSILFLIALVVSASELFARSGTSQVAWPGQPVAGRADWPSNALELINDPTRTEGWNPWFSEWPNDVKHFTFKVRDSDDVNRLIRKLAAIPTTNVQIKLSPEREPASLGFTTRLKPGNGHAALFSLGSQKMIDTWYARQKEAEPGVRQFGVLRHTNAPAALPPTLTLYAGSPRIDLAHLDIPAHVQVTADIPDSAQKEKPDDPTFKAIDTFVARHQATQQPAAARQK
jgi:hypothetical protein